MSQNFFSTEFVKVNDQGDMNISREVWIMAVCAIPLTFITGAFSMQIDELQTPAPVYAFVIASILAVGLSYTLRLVVRSTSVLQWKRAHWERTFTWIRNTSEAWNATVPL